MTKSNLKSRDFRLTKQVLISLVVFWLCSAMGFAQNVVKGIVSDKSGSPLIGATVLVKGTNNGTITDIDGKYSLKAKVKDILVFSYMGMLTQEVKVTSKRVINVTLKDDVSALDEVIVVGYGTQKRGSVTGAVSMVSDKEILKAPTMSVSNIIGSRVAGISAVQSSGQPGADAASLKIRGQSGIIYVIDGIRRTSTDFNELDPNEIESVSVLKDASAVAVYGLDANGAFIVTTKKGKTRKTSITYTGNVGISQNASQQEWLDGPGYAHWYNKARVLDGDTEVFTSEMVDKMKKGIDGWGNTNWYDKLYGTGTKHHHNLSASGGNEKIRFFSSLGYLNEKGNIDNYNYERINLRSNINAKLANNLTFTLGISGRISKHDSPRYSANPNTWHNVPQQIIRGLPYVPTTMDKDGDTYYVSTRTASSPVCPLGSINESGYNKQHNTYIQTNFSLKYDAPWLKGLNFKFQGAYDATYNFGKVLSIPYKTMVANLPNASTTNLTYVLSNDPGGNNIILSEGATKGYNLTTQTSINYNNTFGKHSIKLLALAETREGKRNWLNASGTGLDFIQLDELDYITNKTANGEEKTPTIGGNSTHSRVAGFVGRINYEYDNKYLLEASLRYDGSYLFGGMNKRWITLPGLSLGWRMNNEEWFNLSFINSLKLRASVGKTATSGIGSFKWRNTMGLVGNTAMFGGNSQSMVYADVLGNPNLRWSQCMNYNFGFDATLWNGLLGLEFDVFYKYEYDLLSRITGSYSPSRGGYYPSAGNANKIDYKGFDLTFTHRNKIGDFSYGAKLIWSYSYARWLKYSGDAENTPDYLKVTGKQVGAKRGFLSQGLFQSQKEINNSAIVVGYPVVPGYIKYVDRNGDGVITAAQDMGYVGKSSTPTHTGSLNLFGNWKGFDFDVLFSWGLGHDVALTGQYTAAGASGVMDNTSFTKMFYHGGNSPVFLAENSWTPQNPNGEFPRLSVVNISNNNGYSSDFWYKKGDYIRLKTIQLGYNFPQKWITPTGLSALRIYVEGYNLFTLSEVSKYNIDPESPAVNNGYYPQQKTYSLGLKMTF